MTITTRTTVADRRVIYEVIVDDRSVWRRAVSLSRTKRAIQLAREQQRVARRLLAQS